MKRIPLTQGKLAIVDDEDYESLMQWSWYFDGKYAVRNFSVADGRSISKVTMHRHIMGEPPGLLVDHKKRLRRLDNRRSNLRICTRSQNNTNRGVQSRNLTGLKGVSRNHNRGPKGISHPFGARILIEGRQIWLGCFRTALAAHRAYNRASKQFQGEFSYIN